jgi:hypothetical protein
MGADAGPRPICHGPAPARAAAGAHSRVSKRAASATTPSWPQVSAAKMRAPASDSDHKHAQMHSYLALPAPKSV